MKWMHRLGMAASLAVGVVVYLLWDSAFQAGTPDIEAAPMVAARPASTGPALAASARTQRAGGPELDTDRMTNPLQLTHDLRTIYERFRDSKNVRERNIAYRAWSACFPAFISASGGMASLSQMTTGFSNTDPMASRRADAMREIWSRCRRFSDMPHDQLMSETQRQHDAWMTGKAHSPGESAAKWHMDGDSKEALRIAREAVASQDPYAIDSLKDFVVHYWWDLNDTHPEQRVDRPDLRALAFAVAACNMGLECGPASLTAVQQCASGGACSGDAVDRYLQSLPTQSDRDVVLAESRRVERAIRAKDYAGLGLQ